MKITSLHETLGNTNMHKEQDRNSKAQCYLIYVMKSSEQYVPVLCITANSYKLQLMLMYIA